MSDFYVTAAHVLPETASDERMHVLDDTCWCRPVIDTDAWQIQHKAPQGVRYGRRVVHEIAGRDTKGNALTICGRTLNRLGPDYTEVVPEDVPIGQHCLGCWK